MTVHAFPSGPFETNAYIVVCPETKEAAIIDPAPESGAPILEFLQRNNLNTSKILLTHSHWDHIADTALLKKRLQVPVYIHSMDKDNLEKPGADRLPCWIEIEGVIPDVLVKEGDHVAIGSLDFEVIHTPGHTPGGICFYCAKEGILLSGDTLFKGTIGNISFPTSTPHLMWDSLRKLAKLPPSTKVYPGHGPTTTIAAESWLDRAEDVFG